MAILVTGARPYAHAIFKSAQESHQLEVWSEVLSLLSIIVQDKEMALCIENPTISSLKIKAMILDTLSIAYAGAKPILKKVDTLLQLLLEAKRLATLPSIQTVFHELLTTKNGVVEAEVFFCFPLSDAQQNQLQSWLKKKFHSEVSLKMTPDRSLLGGVFIRVGNWTMDASIKERLNRLSENLVG